MVKRLVFLSLFGFIHVFGFAQKPIGIGQWRTHLPYNAVQSLAEASDLMYVAAQTSFYSFNLRTGEIELYSKVNGFSDVEVSTLAYNWEKEMLLIAYRNTNIDILVKGRTIINVPDILRETVIGEKEINDVYFYKDVAYIATTFGIAKLDLVKFEIQADFQRIGPMGQLGQITPVRSVCIVNDVIYATTPDGVVKADINANLSDANSWQLELARDPLNTSGGGEMIDYKGYIYAHVDSVLKVYDGNSWSLFNGPAGQVTSGLDVNQNKLVIAQEDQIWVVDESRNKTIYDLRYTNYATIDREGILWAGGDGTGLININAMGETGYVQPNGPPGITSFAIKQFNNAMWVMAGGADENWQPGFNNLGIYYYANGTWLDYRQNKPQLQQMSDFVDMAANQSTNEIFFGTMAKGVAHVVNGQVVNVYNETNSTLFKSGDWVTCSGVALDDEGNLWVTNFNESNMRDALSVRKRDGTWKSFELPDARVGRIVIDHEGQKWMTSPNNSDIGIIVFKEVNGIDGDDIPLRRILTTGERSGDLPSNRVNILLLDENGEIWVGTEEGLAIFYIPENVFEGGLDADAQRIIIDDGKDVGYLLGTEVINDMAIDGANRKWVATNTGVWLIEEDGSKVLKHFTTKNSPLLSNTVKCVGIDQVTGEVYFGTDKGIISYRGDATRAGDKHGDVVVFPNPVREDYHGVITITGLPTNATVKITDVAGRVVYEMISDGGTAVWNGRSFSGERPASGIYLIFSANEKDEDALVSKLLIVN